MAKRGGFPGGMGGGMNMQKMMMQAQKMQLEMSKAQEEIKEMTFEASAGGGMVKAVAKGTMTIESLTIDPAAVDPDDAEMLQDMVLAAVNEALHTAEETRQSELGKLAPGMGGMF